MQRYFWYVFLTSSNSNVMRRLWNSQHSVYGGPLSCMSQRNYYFDVERFHSLFGYTLFNWYALCLEEWKHHLQILKYRPDTWTLFHSYMFLGQITKNRYNYNGDSIWFVYAFARKLPFFFYFLVRFYIRFKTLVQNKVRVVYLVPMFLR